jgi:hypothetical protein
LIRRGSIISVKTLEIDTPFGTANAHLSSADEPRAALVLGHGAGGGVHAKDLVAVAGVAYSVGMTVALVEQPYRVAGRRFQHPSARYSLDGDRPSGRRPAARFLFSWAGGLRARVSLATAEAVGHQVLCLAFLQPPRRTGAAPHRAGWPSSMP